MKCGIKKKMLVDEWFGNMYVQSGVNKESL
jgi:hypothetical protein